jgi:hypothetical protein
MIFGELWDGFSEKRLKIRIKSFTCHFLIKQG